MTQRPNVPARIRLSLVSIREPPMPRPLRWMPRASPGAGRSADRDHALRNPEWSSRMPRRCLRPPSPVSAKSIAASGQTAGNVAALGIANQTETLVMWDPKTGKPALPAMVWQCRRGAEEIAASPARQSSIHQGAHRARSRSDLHRGEIHYGYSATGLKLPMGFAPEDVCSALSILG